MINVQEEYRKLAENLSFDDFCRVMVNIKHRDGLTWDQVKDICNTLYNVNYTSSCYKSKRDRDFYSAQYSDLKDRMKLSDERVQINAMIRRMSREETLKEIALDVAEKMNKEKILENYQLSKQKNSSSVGLLLIGDWHYGSEFFNCYNRYDPEISQNRVQKLLDKVIEKGEKLNLSTLNVVNLGDMISGNIHLPLRINSRVDVISQTIEVSELIAEFLNELSNHFYINYIAVLDNHSRIDPNKKESLDIENFSRITDWYLRSRLSNINFLSNTVEDIAVINILNHEIAAVHGHKDKPATMVSSINSFAKNKFDLICAGHYHSFSVDDDCDTSLIINGSLMGTDDHAVSLRKHSLPSQTLIEITYDDVLESIHRIKLVD